MPLEELITRHIGPVAHDRNIKQLLFGVLPAGGKPAPMATGYLLTDEHYSSLLTITLDWRLHIFHSYYREELACQQQTPPRRGVV